MNCATTLILLAYELDGPPYYFRMKPVTLHMNFRLISTNLKSVTVEGYDESRFVLFIKFVLKCHTFLTPFKILLNLFFNFELEACWLVDWAIPENIHPPLYGRH